jgi:hypothetical protein
LVGCGVGNLVEFNMVVGMSEGLIVGEEVTLVLIVGRADG